MKNKSIFSGVKELKDLQFIHTPYAWKVYEYSKNAWLYIGSLSLIKGESNRLLYARGKELQARSNNH